MASPSGSEYVAFEGFTTTDLASSPLPMPSMDEDTPGVSNIPSAPSMHDAAGVADPFDLYPSPGVDGSPYAPGTKVGSTNGSTSVLIQRLNQMLVLQAAAQEMLMKTMLQSQDSSTKNMIEANHKAKTRLALTATAADIAKAAAVTRHNGYTKDADLRWAMARSMVRRLCPAALELLESEAPPKPEDWETNARWRRTHPTVGARGMMVAKEGDAKEHGAHAGREVETPRVCLNCGKDNHITRMCRFKCGTCKLSYCGAGHGGKACPLKGGSMPAREKILNALGKPVPTFL
mmetsp:Transcript_15722/g.34096  ORF Transcript_15722/g.34096 Transcript_15722/m.34096 type:complete len:290 (-) Transcript_15722:234-1103(-)